MNGTLAKAMKPTEIERQSIGFRRDVRLDALRGLMLVIMAVDHLPNALSNFTTESLGFVSAAEGFVFLSGYVAGLSYTRLAMEESKKSLWKRAVYRAIQIYLYQVGLFALALLGLAFGFLHAERFQNWIPLFYTNPGMTILLGAALLYQPLGMHILPMYCALILVTPPLIKMLVAGRWLTVLFLSSTLWFCAQFALWAALLSLVTPKLPVDLGSFDLFGWQVLFVLGVVFGFRRCVRDRKEGSNASPAESFCDCGMRIPHREWLRRPIIIILTYVSAMVFYLLRHDLAFVGAEDLLRPYAAKSNLGPLRLVNFGALAILISHPWLWPNSRFWVRALAYLGRHSLQVFAFSIACDYAANNFFGPWEVNNEILKVCGAGLGAISLYIPAWVHEHWNDRRRRRNLRRF